MSSRIWLLGRENKNREFIINISNNSVSREMLHIHRRLEQVISLSSQNSKIEVKCWFLLGIACEQALLGVGGGRGKEERACNDVSGIFISALNFSTQNADWWILNLVLTSLLFACVVLTTQTWWRSF